MKIEVKVPRAPSKANIKFPVLAQDITDGAIFLFFSNEAAVPVGWYGHPPTLGTDYCLLGDAWVILPVGSQVTFTQE